MIRPRLIGYWSDQESPQWPDVAVFIDSSWDPVERQTVVAYLSAGRPTPWVRYCGFSRCRVCDRPNGSAELTDGAFIWPEGLVHYVAEHDVRLPKRFVAHVRWKRRPPKRLPVRGLLCDITMNRRWWLRQRTL